MLSNGQKFWSGTKRCPRPLQFDAADPTHMAFIVSAANLHAVVNGVPDAEHHTDEARFRTSLASVVVPAFSPVDGVKTATTDADAKKEVPRRLFVCSCVSCVRSFVRSLVRSFVRSFVHSSPRTRFLLTVLLGYVRVPAPPFVPRICL